MTVAELDLRVGGASLVVMRGPDGTDYPNWGVYLDLVPGTRTVWTAADREAHEAMGFHQGWGRCADQLARLAEGL